MIFNRREFLCGSSAMAFSSSAFMRMLAKPAEAATGKTIVIVYEFQGGNDGFNMVIPLDATNSADYYKLRSNIAVANSAIETAQTYFDATPSAVGTGSTYAFNPVMTELRSLYAQGRVAVLSGIGLLPSVPNRDSHQEGQYYWASGSVSDDSTADLGWIGQTFDTIGATPGAIAPMVAVNGSLPIAMIGAKTSPLVVGGDLGGFQVNTGYAGTTAGDRSIFGNDAYATTSMSSEFARSVANQTTNAISIVQSYAKAVNPDQVGGGPLSGQYPVTPAYPAYNLMITYPGGTPKTSYVKIQLAQIARLILAGAPTRGYYVRQGGYDTHSSEVAQQPLLLQEFSEAVSEFYAYMKAQSASSNVIIMTTSEFGRLPFSNASAGTDHGSASFHYIIGDPVVGGLYGTEIYPSLAPGLTGGYVGVDIDFRYHLSIGMQYLGVDPETVLGTAAFNTLSTAGANLQNIIPSL